VWQIYDGRITWFSLDEGEYKELTADEQGIIRSQVFPGLWLAVEAFLADDLATVLAVCQQGIVKARD
jgi:Uma2 family endonuclease